VQRLVERLRSAGRQGDGGVVLRIGEQPPIDLTNASAAEVVEAVEKVLARQQDR
jgi:hypothetical protein